MSVNTSNAVPSGPEPANSFNLSTDKILYRPGDTVVIKADDTFYDDYLFLVTIRKGSFNDEEVNQIYSNLQLVYKEQHRMTNPYTEITYQLPLESDSLFGQQSEKYVVLINEPPDPSEGPPMKSLSFRVLHDGMDPLPLALGIGVAIAAVIGFVSLKHKKKSLP